MTTRACLRTTSSIPLLEALVLPTGRSPTWSATDTTAELVVRVAALVDGAEYKRRQSPPGVRITAKAFGKDRRMPITNRYRDPRPGGDFGGAVHGPRR